MGKTITRATGERVSAYASGDGSLRLCVSFQGVAQPGNATDMEACTLAPDGWEVERAGDGHRIIPKRYRRANKADINRLCKAYNQAHALTYNDTGYLMYADVRGDGSNRPSFYVVSTPWGGVTNVANNYRKATTRATCDHMLELLANACLKGNADASLIRNDRARFEVMQKMVAIGKSDTK